MFKRTFWNPEEGRPRAAWRLVLHALLLAGIALVPVALAGEGFTWARRHGLLLPGLGEPAYDKVVNLIVGPLFTALVVASVALAGRWLDRRRFADFGLHWDRRGWGDLGFGILLGFLLVAAVFLVELAAGWATVTEAFEVRSAGVPLALALVYSLMKAACVATYEELVSRGYHLRNLTEGFGDLAGRGAFVLAALASSAVFATLHAFNEHTGIGSLAGLLVNGLMLATAVAATGRLALSIGIHAGWNLAEGSLFGFPVSGDLESASVLTVATGGSELATGGDFGPEAGLLGIAAMLVGIVVIRLGWSSPGSARAR